MDKVYKKRLRTLADFMKTVPEKRFSIHEWTTGDFCGKAQEPEHAKCGTAACVGGWACSIKEFRRAGLTLSKADEEGYYEPRFQGYSSHDAVRSFFGLEDLELPSQLRQSDATEYIFGVDNTNSAKSAVKRIENVLKVVELQEQLNAIR